MLQLYSLRPLISSRNQESSWVSSKRKSRLCRCRWIPITTFRLDNLLVNNREKWKSISRITQRKLGPSMKISISSKLNSLPTVDLKNSPQPVQDWGAKLLMASLSSYFIVRLIHINSTNAAMNVVQESFHYAVRTFAASSLPFACMSNSLSKPTPLQLDVSLPSFQDVRWSFARLIYLFNIQLERNVATFFIVLLAACFSFVIIGGFLFFKFRGSTQSLEDCFWEAWACLCSSSTHLKV